MEVFSWARRQMVTMGLATSMQRGVLIVALMCAFVAVGYSQANNGQIDYNTISLKEARDAIDAMEGQDSRRNFAIGALKSKRNDLIELCFQNQYTMGWIREDVRNMPASRFKDAMAVMMLKSDSPFWPPDGFVIQGSRGLGSMVLEPFASVARAYFPNRVIDERDLKSRQARMNLARDIERAMKEAESKHGPPLTPAARSAI